MDSFLQYLLSWYTDWDEETRRLEPPNFNGSFPYLKTIKILNFNGCVLPFIKYLLKHAIVLEKFDIVAAVQRNHTSLDYVTVASEVLSYPRSSPHASVYSLIDNFGPLLLGIYNFMFVTVWFAVKNSVIIWNQLIKFE